MFIDKWLERQISKPIGASLAAETEISTERASDESPQDVFEWKTAAICMEGLSWSYQELLGCHAFSPASLGAALESHRREACSLVGSAVLVQLLR
ncbi:MAG: hypothetical protein HC897_18810 [Thermoanaerobaculia bacterium]|nr:hypothetical protein [Thermoanaerobaculia bacterium]